MLTLSHIKNHVIMYTQYWDFRIKYKKVVFETKAKILCSVATKILLDFLMTLVFWTPCLIKCILLQIIKNVLI